jgi:hypothetical protein
MDTRYGLRIAGEIPGLPVLQFDEVEQLYLYAAELFRQQAQAQIVAGVEQDG